MKTIYLLVLSIIVILTTAGCKNNENKPEPGVQTMEALGVTETMAVLWGKINAFNPWILDEKGFEFSTEPLFTKEKTKKFREPYFGENFLYQVERLVPGKTYYYRAYLVNQELLYQGEARTFTTKSIDYSSGEVSELTCHSVKITNRINTEDWISAFGICYGKTDQLNYYSSDHVAGSSRDDDGIFSCQLRSLTGATKYYYCTYVCINDYYYYGTVGSFTTVEDDVVETGEIDLNELQVKSRLTNCDGLYNIMQMGLCYSFTNEIPTIGDQCYTVDEADVDSTFTIKLTAIPFEVKVYYRAYVTIDGVAHYGQIKSFERSLAGINFNGHTYVNLGLSVLWATCNIGTEKPENYGDYYAWGETSYKLNYNWGSYKWSDWAPSTLTKYNNNSDYGTVDNKNVLEEEDDVAHTEWSGSWRMPTKGEFDELLQNCTCTWITQNGVNGFLMTSNKANFTDRSIFLPAAGYRSGSRLLYEGASGGYWSSNGSSQIAYSFIFDSGGVDKYNSQVDRCRGLSVRPVCP